jgi:hypothetical protein
MARPTPDHRLWRKSSYSGKDNCVALSPTAGVAPVRDSKAPHGRRLHFASAAFAGFLALTEQHRVSLDR